MEIYFLDTNADFLFGYKKVSYIPRIGERIYKNNTIYVVKYVIHDYDNRYISIIIDKN